MSDDLISRQKAIDLFKHWFKELNLYPDVYIDDLISLSSEQVTKWIPVSERFPNEDGRYLLTVNDRVRIGYWADNLLKVDDWDFYDKDHCGFYDYDNEWGHYEIHNVVAWMPLPEPYKEAENE